MYHSDPLILFSLKYWYNVLFKFLKFSYSLICPLMDDLTLKVFNIKYYSTYFSSLSINLLNLEPTPDDTDDRSSLKYYNISKNVS